MFRATVTALRNVTKNKHDSFKFHTSTPREQMPRTKQRPTFTHKVRDSFLILEAQQGPVGKTLVGIGQGLFTGGLVYGTGALVYYGFFHNKAKSIQDEFDPLVPSEKGSKYPAFVRERVRTTYTYVANSLAVSTIGAMVSFKLFNNMRVLNVVAAHPIAIVGITMGAQMLLTALVRWLPYNEGIGPKQVASVAQASLIGLAAAPLYLLGAQSIIRAGFVTAGVAGGLSALSTIFPDDSFTSWERPLRVGMYSVLLAFMSLWFIPRGHLLYNSLYKIAMHGGLIVFPAYYLHNSKAVLQSAKYTSHYDPINASMGLYTDILNIYGRLAFLLPPHYLISGHPTPSPK